MTNTDTWTPWTPCKEDLTYAPVVGRADPQLAALAAAIGRWPEGALPDCDRPHALPDLPDDAYPDESILLPAGIMPVARSAANDNYPRLIALTGAAGSGKSTAASYLVEHHGYVRVRFAQPLKDMMAALGLDERHIEGDLKQTPMEELSGQTPRYAMQTLGTEWGRNCMGDDFWVNLWRQDALRHERVVVDDCRFPNEAEAIHALGGKIIKITGRGGIAGAHASEAGCGVSDGQVTNDGCVVDLYAGVEQEVRRWVA